MKKKRKMPEEVPAIAAKASKNPRLHVPRPAQMMVPMVPPSAAGAIIRVGTDFSGIETPLQALKGLGVPFRHMFAAESQPHLRKFIRKLFPVEGRVYKDVGKREVTTVPEVDVYVAGPPCQPWSSAGQQMGLEDLRGRGVLLFATLEYIRARRPAVIILENVANLARKFKGELENLCHILRVELHYEVHWNLMDTLGHGLPHSRPRVYIVGFASPPVRPFKFPQPLKHCVNVTTILERTNKVVSVRPHDNDLAKWNISWAKVNFDGNEFQKKPVFVDIDAGKNFAHWTVGHLPCLTACRGRDRRVTLTEMMRFQGMLPKRLAVWGACMTERQMGHALGNAMSVNVLQRVLVRALKASGLAVVRDPWRDPLCNPWRRAADGGAAS